MRNGVSRLRRVTAKASTPLVCLGIDASRYAHNEATGVEWYSFQIINNLIKKVFNSKKNKIILYFRDKPQFPPEVQKLINLNRKCIQLKIIKAKRLWTILGLSKELKKNPVDVLFVPSHVLPLVLPKKSVIMIHDTAFMHLKKSYSWTAYKYLEWSTKFAVKNASKIIVPSNSTKQDLISLFNCPKNKIAVIPHGFDIVKFDKNDILEYLEKWQDFKYILFIGRLESKKNLVRLVKAFKIFSKSYPRYKLVLAGKKGNGFDEIFKTIVKLKLIDKVIIPGYINEKEKAALMMCCKMFAFPSLYEGFGFPILESFYFGKPVLTSNISSMTEVAGKAALYVNPYDVKNISDGLTKIIKDNKYQKELVGKGKRQLKKFSWSSATKKLFKILTDG
ncbi:glycosyltransferase family 4 protein [Candidatus Peregrinibacteria bacterium]|nr:glycosyltransferase family 4 protein [Candidatus Peregrinibacteria bacterium]